MKRPRRKRRRQLRDPPLPVPVASLTGESVGPRSWFYYAGRLRGANVVVSHSGDASFLYSMGCFGKGNLSRSKPDFSQRCFTAQIERPGEETFIPARVTSRRHYIRHLKSSRPDLKHLSELCECNGSDEDEEEDEEAEDFHPWQPWTTVMTDSQAAESKEMLDGVEVCMGDENQGLCDERSWQAAASSTKPASDSWSAAKASWDSNAGGDADFWGTGDAKDNDVKSHADSEEKNHSRATPQTRDVGGGGEAVAEISSSSNCGSFGCAGSGHKCSVDTDVCSECQGQGSWRKVDRGVKRKLEAPEEEAVEMTSSKTCDSDMRQSGTSGKHNSAFSDLSHQSKDVNHATRKSFALDGDAPASSALDHNSHSPHALSSRPEASCVPENGGTVPCGEGTEDPKLLAEPDAAALLPVARPQPASRADGLPHLRCLYACADGVDPLCEEGEEEDGDVLVVADSDEEVRGERQCLRHPSRWLPVLKRDPWPPAEELHLSLEEAFFLSYGLGCLTVTRDGEERPLGLEELWRECCRLQERFAARYLVYQHLRSKGWTPKPGLKFSCDFVVYEDGPLQTHSSYCVLVRQVREDRLQVEVDTVTDLHCLDPILFSGANRMINTVSKELLLCYAVIPSDMDEKLLNSPRCISQLSVLETSVSRWIPSQERVAKPHSSS